VVKFPRCSRGTAEAHASARAPVIMTTSWGTDALMAKDVKQAHRAETSWARTRDPAPATRPARETSSSDSRRNRSRWHAATMRNATAAEHAKRALHAPPRRTIAAPARLVAQTSAAVRHAKTLRFTVVATLNCVRSTRSAVANDFPQII